MKTVLVTGCCGFIGRHFTKKMCDLGYIVTGVDNLMSNSALIPSKWSTHLQCEFEFNNCDILEYLQRYNVQFDIIIHAAAIVGGRQTIENDPLLVARNINIDNELFRWIEKNPAGHLIYFSSSAVYPIRHQTDVNYKKLGLNDLDVITDNLSIPDLTYGWSKLTGEFLLSILAKRVNTIISIYRPFSGYGEDQHESYPFPSILKKAIASSSNIEIWSDAVRDFVYIDDIVNYVLSTCFHNKPLQILNIGSGRATSMSDLAQTIMKHLPNNISKTITILQDKPKGVYYRVSEENDDFNWMSLEDGIKKCLSYQ
jgi:nucleoside-diphosphate-sugar epimerase